MKLIIFILALAPTLYESWTDRKGEKKREKFWDGVILVGYSILLTGGAWWLGYRPLPVIGLILVTRFAFFDYLVNAFLKRYSPGHKDINIWKFTGTVAFTDRLTAKVDWRLRILFRVALFCLAFWWYINLLG